MFSINNLHLHLYVAVSLGLLLSYSHFFIYFPYFPRDRPAHFDLLKQLSLRTGGWQHTMHINARCNTVLQ